MDDDFRIAELEKDVRALQEQIKVVPVLAERIVQQNYALERVEKKMDNGFASAKDDNKAVIEDGKATRKVLIAFAFTISGTCIAALIGVLQVIAQ